MPTHVYSNDALTRIFEAPPSHPVAAVSLVDESGEIRRRLLAEGLLVPAANRAKPRVSVPVDSDTFHEAACEIVATHKNKFARAVADSPDSDTRLVSALRTILALPPATRDQVVSRSARKKVAA